jgi:DNA-binding MarR family transcriptional regulator
MIQKTSLESYKEIKQNLGYKQRLVLNTIKLIQPCTNSMIAEHLNLPINTITPRCIELRDKKFVTYSHTEMCPVTKRNAMYWKLTKLGYFN